MGQSHSHRPCRLRTPDGRERNAAVVIPSTPPPPHGRAMVLMLHGAGGSSDSVMSGTRWGQLAERENFVVVCPDGTACDETRPQNFLRNPQTWNSGQGFSLSSGELSAEAKGIDDVGFLSALIQHVSTLTAINPRQIFVAGHSNGACMAFRFAADRADLVAACGVCAGHLRADLVSLSNPVALMCVSGDQDPFAPLAGGPAGLKARGNLVMVRAQRLNATEWARANGIPDAAVTVRNDALVVDTRWGPHDKGVEVRWVVVKNHGHSWPGGVDRLPAMLMGPKSDAFDATLEMWIFFSAHPKS